jgi:PKHD-type hydroxylase
MDNYAMYHRGQMLTPAVCNLLVQGIENGVNPWSEYKIGADDNGMTVHQWTHDLDEQRYEELYTSVWALMAGVNRLVWDFDIRHWQQPLRVAKYTPGLSHDWHVDYTVEDTSKLAFSVALNNGYSGGELQILEAGRIAKPKIGEATWFPAFQGHRVTPVTKGTRYVLLGWFTGPRFR